jgi:hypothetical protein
MDSYLVLKLRKCFLSAPARYYIETSCYYAVWPGFKNGTSSISIYIVLCTKHMQYIQDTGPLENSNSAWDNSTRGDEIFFFSFSPRLFQRSFTSRSLRDNYLRGFGTLDQLVVAAIQSVSNRKTRRGLSWKFCLKYLSSEIYSWHTFSRMFNVFCVVFLCEGKYVPHQGQLPRCYGWGPWRWLIWETWLILPVVIRSSQRLSHAGLSINISLWNCEWLIISVIVYLIVPYYLDNRSNSRANTCINTLMG